jgi:hypothetical protein
MGSAASVLERIIRPAKGDLPAGLATYLLTLHFPPSDHVRYEKLSAKAQDGLLTEVEKTALDDLLTANDVLMILHSKASASLKKRKNSAA